MTWPLENSKLTILLIFTGAALLIVKLLTDLIQQFRQAAAGCRRNPSMRVIHPGSVLLVDSDDLTDWIVQR